MKKFLINLSFFVVNLALVLVVVGFILYAPMVVSPNDPSGIAVFALMGMIVFLIWAGVCSYFFAKKERTNWFVVTGGTVGYILASASLNALVVSVVSFALFHSVFKYVNKDKVKKQQA